MDYAYLALTFVGVLAILIVVLAICFRKVVDTNTVHIVQSARTTISFGKEQSAGNVYYNWPAWVPVVGVQTVTLPTSVFNIGLKDYAAYDKGRVPFVIDVMAFFRISDSNTAAQRVASLAELNTQLVNILQGSTRTILAQHDIEEILEGRGKFGQAFTAEVDGQLKEWGVTSVKMIELMDIRDARESQVIENIMAKKKSAIEMASRIEVAQNHQKAQEAEIDADQQVKLRRAGAEQSVGQRVAEQEREVAISREKAQQGVSEQSAITAEREMAVKKVQTVRAAEIAKAAQTVAAEQDRDVRAIKAEGDQKQTEIVAKGQLQAAKYHAEGIEIEGKARGEAEKAVLMAPVQAQITLAEKIAELPAYQTYLVSIRQIEANQVVGIEQAKALEKADVKVISNTGAPVDGVKSVMDLFTTKGGTQIGGALEALAQTETGQALIAKFLPAPAKPNGTGKPA